MTLNHSWSIVVVVAALAPFYACQIGTATTATAEAEEIVSRHVEALGGRERLSAAKSMRVAGSYMFNGESFDFVLLRRRPSQFRLEIRQQDTTSIEGSDGQVAWRISPRTGSSASLLEGDEATRFFEEWVDFDGPLIGHADKGHRVEFLGEEDIEGTICFHLRLRLASGNQQHWFLDKESLLLVRKVTPQVHPRRGPYDRIWYFESYRSVEGLQVPEYFEREDRQFVRAYEVTSVELDVDLPDELFSPPTDRLSTDP